MSKKDYYYKRKEEARQEAINWQNSQIDECMSWGEVADCCDYFYRLGKKYGLVREFRENGIC